jgi:hypothetical protein
MQFGNGFNRGRRPDEQDLASGLMIDEEAAASPSGDNDDEIPFCLARTHEPQNEAPESQL